MATIPQSVVSPTPSDIARFNRKVERSEQGCWMWVGAMRPNGYGNFNLGNKTTGAHRAAWILANGPIPDGLQVLHRCDVPSCVNPSHLFLGTQEDNMQDMIAKGRQGSYARIGEANPMYGRRHSEKTRAMISAVHRGLHAREKHPRATITEKTAQEVKRLRTEGLTCPSIAQALSISIHVVRNIAGGKSWR